MTNVSAAKEQKPGLQAVPYALFKSKERGLSPLRVGIDTGGTPVVLFCFFFLTSEKKEVGVGVKPQVIKSGAFGHFLPTYPLALPPNRYIFIIYSYILCV